MPPATAWQSTSKQSHRAYYHNKREFSFTNPEVLHWYHYPQPKARGKTERREMSAWTRDFTQAEWWPRWEQGSAPLSTIAASSLISCIIISAGKDFMGCIVCQNTCRKAEAVKYYTLLTSSHSAWDLGRGPVRRASLQHWPTAAETSFGGNCRNTAVMKQSIKDWSLFYLTKIQELTFL